MTNSDQALEYFNRNFNCSQGVFTTYAGKMGIDEKLSLKLATNFGGGARKGEMCGAVSGALMVLGLIFGHCDEDDQDSKAKAYAISEEFMDRFIERNGSVVCRNLLGYDLSNEAEMEIIRQKVLFHTICPKMIVSATEILDEILDEHMVSV